MYYILDLPSLGTVKDLELGVIDAKWDVYSRYIDSLKGKLPSAAYSYARSEAHSNYAHEQSTHDGWIERVVIEEPFGGQRQEKREIAITIELLAGCHAGRIRFTYPGVQSYELGAPLEFEFPPEVRVGHGDWLVDEVQLTEHGYVLHQIRFSRGAVWRIESLDLRYEWLPLSPHT